MKKLAASILVLGLIVLLAWPAVATEAQPPAWQQQYWELYWEHMQSYYCLEYGGWPSFRLMDLNNDGTLELVVKIAGDEWSSHWAAIMVDGHAHKIPLGRGGRAYRHRDTGELRYFFLHEFNDHHFHSSIEEVFFDWDNYSAASHFMAGTRFYDGTSGIFIGNRRTDWNAFTRFRRQLLREWREIPGRDLAGDGTSLEFWLRREDVADISETLFAQARAQAEQAFFAAMDELTGDQSIKELYWPLYWELMGDSLHHGVFVRPGDFSPHPGAQQISLMDLNEDGVPELIVSCAALDSIFILPYHIETSGMRVPYFIATIADGQARPFEGMHRTPKQAYRHTRSGEIRFFELHDSEEQTYIAEAVLDWRSFTFIRVDIARGVEYRPRSFLIGGFDGRYVLRQEYYEFFNSFLDGWEEIPGLGIGLPGIDVNIAIDAESFAAQIDLDTLRYEKIKASFLAALDEMAQDGSIYAAPLPDTWPAAAPIEGAVLVELPGVSPVARLWPALAGGATVLIAAGLILLLLKRRKR